MGRKAQPPEKRKMSVPSNLYEKDVFYLRTRFPYGYAEFVRETVHEAIEDLCESERGSS